MVAPTVQRAKSSSGFTLLELLLVFTILALVLGLSSTSLRTPTESSTLRTEARILLAELRSTRARALGESRPYSIETVEEGRGYRVMPSGEQRILPEGLSMVISQGGSAAQYEIVSSTPALRFYPNGSTSGGRAVLATENQTQSLTVNWLTGEISLAPAPESTNATGS